MRLTGKFWHSRTVLFFCGSMVLFLALFAVAPVCRPQGEPVVDTPGVKTLRGLVSSIDWVASTIVVRWLDQTVYDEMTFTIPSDVQVYIRNQPVELSDINLSDDVTIEYINNGYAGLKVLSITVSSPLSGD